MWQQICVDIIKLSSWTGFKALNCLLTQLFVAVRLSTLQMSQISELFPPNPPHSLLLFCTGNILCMTGIKTMVHVHGFSPISGPADCWSLILYNHWLNFGMTLLYRTRSVGVNQINRIFLALWWFLHQIGKAQLWYLGETLLYVNQTNGSFSCTCL